MEKEQLDKIIDTFNLLGQTILLLTNKQQISSSSFDKNIQQLPITPIYNNNIEINKRKRKRSYGKTVDKIMKENKIKKKLNDQEKEHEENNNNNLKEEDIFEENKNKEEITNIEKQENEEEEDNICPSDSASNALVSNLEMKRLYCDNVDRSKRIPVRQSNSELLRQWKKLSSYGNNKNKVLKKNCDNQDSDHYFQNKNQKYHDNKELEQWRNSEVYQKVLLQQK